MPDEQYDFDVAVSFAGEDRTVVAEVVEGLKTRGISVFYDQYFAAETWGENLVDYPQSVYQYRARFVIMFVSRHYRDKMWTRYERATAQSRALRHDAVVILPVRLDDTELPGLQATTGCSVPEPRTWRSVARRNPATPAGSNTSPGGS